MARPSRSLTSRVVAGLSTRVVLGVVVRCGVATEVLCDGGVAISCAGCDVVNLAESFVLLKSKWREAAVPPPLSYFFFPTVHVLAPCDADVQRLQI